MKKGNENRQKLDLSEEFITKLHHKCKNQKEDLYTFLKNEFPNLDIEDRLKYLATVLNDYMEEYEWDEKAPRHKDEGYLIVKFYPTHSSS